MVSFFSKDISGNELIKTKYTPTIFLFAAIFGLLIIFSFYFFILNGEFFFIYFKTLLQIIALLLVLGGFFSLIIYFLLYVSWSVTIITSIFNIFLTILTLTVLYQFLFKSYIQKIQNPLVLFIIDVIFYLPCLFIEFIEYIKSEYKISTKSEKLILLIELLVIGMRLLLPYLFNLYNKFFGTKGDIIESGPIYLNKQHSFGIIKNKDIKSYKTTDNSIKSKLDNYNYAISTWIWINPQPPSTNSAYNTSTSLLDYGNVLQINFVKNNIEILASTTKEGESSEPLVKIYNTKNIQYQKWNNIILNYNGGTLDVFLNNNIVASSINITPIMYNNKITVGSNNGIHGGIKDIIYYDNVLSRNDINSIYSKG